MGLSNLKYYDEVLADRKNKYLYYTEKLSSLDYLSFQVIKTGAPNYSYFPIIFDTEDRLIGTEKRLNSENVFPRRYFYPSVNTYTAVVDYQPTPISEDLSRRILCLPLYWGLKMDELDKIIKIILQAD